MSSQPILSTNEPERGWVSRMVEDLPPSGIRKFFDLVVGTPGVISLGVGEPDFVTPWHICEAGIHSLERGMTSYTPNQGLLALRQAVSGYLNEEFGVTYSPDTEILITVGGSEAVDLVCRAVLEPHDEAIVTQPCFVAYTPLVSLAHGTPVVVDCFAKDGFLPTRSSLDAAVSERSRILIVNFPNNPTGAGLDRATFEMITEFAIENDLLLVSDEVYVPLTYSDEVFSFTSVPELRHRFLLVHSFSKGWAMTGWRMGFCAGPPELVAAMTKIHQYSIMCTPTTAQMAAIEALARGRKEMLAMKREYDRRRRFIVKSFNELGLKTVDPKGAFYVFPDVRETGLSSEEFALRLLEEERVAVVPGTAFGACGEGHVRCSYASSMDALREAVTRIDKFLKRL